MIPSEHTVPETFHHTGPQVLCVPQLCSSPTERSSVLERLLGPKMPGWIQSTRWQKQFEFRDPQGKWTSHVKTEMKIENSNLFKFWKIFKPKILRHDGTLNHESLVACSYCSIYLWLWYMSLGHPKSPNTEPGGTALAHSAMWHLCREMLLGTSRQ